MNLCEYSDIFGKAGEGAHSIRFMNIAIIDLAFTILAAWLISKYYDYNVLYVFGILMILSVVFHRLFCVRSTLTMLFFNF